MVINFVFSIGHNMPDTLLTLLFSIGYFFLLSSIPYFYLFKNNNISILNLVTNNQNLNYKSTFLENYNSAFHSYKETYSIFLCLSILGITMGIPLQTGALLWLISKIIHTQSFIFELIWIKFISYLISLACLIWMIVQIISLNRLTMFSYF